MMLHANAVLTELEVQFLLYIIFYLDYISNH